MVHVMEPMFDIGYLGLVIALGVRLLMEQSGSARRFGVMAILLGGGDAFHLIPRVISHLSLGGFEAHAAMLSWGEFVTSITMTIFYVLFYHYYRERTEDFSSSKRVVIYALAALRIGLTLMPQNGWGAEGSYAFGIVRNIPFVLMGALLILWVMQHKKADGLQHIALLIFLSFLFYVPVVLGARFIPLLGMLMIPKTVAYVFIVRAGYRYFIPTIRTDHFLKLATTFLVLGLVAGVFYREFTRMHRWELGTTLRVTHVHLIALGFLFFFALYAILKTEPEVPTSLSRALTTYITGLSWTVVGFVVRGIYTVVSEGSVRFPDAILSAMAGIGHVILAVGLVWTLVILIRTENRRRGEHAI